VTPVNQNHPAQKGYFAYLGLGSNLGDGAAQISRALELLAARGCAVKRASSLYSTEPVGVREQSWFTNCAAEVTTNLSPRALLRTVKSIERDLGRRQTAPGEPRPIDIDILFYDDGMVHLPSLTIPHPRVPERRFVLIPMKELAPHLRHPVLKKTVSQLLRETADTSQVVHLRDVDSRCRGNDSSGDA